MVGLKQAGVTLAAGSGFQTPTIDDFLPPEIIFQGTPFALNRIILIRVFITVVMLLVLGITAARAKLVPGRWQGAVEWLLDFVRVNIVYEIMGEVRGKRYVPMITTLFFTIFVFNICGIIPGLNIGSQPCRARVLASISRTSCCLRAFRGRFTSSWCPCSCWTSW